MCIVVPNLPNKNPLTSSRSKVSRWPGWSTLPGSRIQWTRALLVGLAFRLLVINSKWVIPETLLLKHAKTICGNVHGKAPVRPERDTRSEPELVHHIFARVWCCPCRRQYNIFFKYFIYPCYTPFLISGHGIYAFDVDETTGALTASGVCPVSVCGSNPS